VRVIHGFHLASWIIRHDLSLGPEHGGLLARDERFDFVPIDESQSMSAVPSLFTPKSAISLSDCVT
jgi:hypothetical protein